MRYYSLKRDFEDTAEKKRVVKNMINLKEDLEKKVPAKIFNENVLIATWNIRDFDSNKFKFGPRTKEAIYYIAEIISSFDLVALQEVNEDLSAFLRLMYILGDKWDYIMTDATGGTSGNGERMAFVYDTNRVDFRKIAGEIVLSKQTLIKDEVQFARTPFIVAFQSGWFNFKLCTVHIYYGSDSGEQLERRIEEIASIAKTLSSRAREYGENLILLGDFNIISPEHQTMQALEKNGFMIPEALKKNPSNMYRTKHYDQIAFKEKRGEIKFADNENSAGVYDYYQKVFTTRQFSDYQPVVLANIEEKIAAQLLKLEKEKKADSILSIQKSIAELNVIKADEDKQKDYYKEDWRTFQMSDHLPMWTELKINFSVNYLTIMGKE